MSYDSFNKFGEPGSGSSRSPKGDRSSCEYPASPIPTLCEKNGCKPGEWSETLNNLKLQKCSICGRTLSAIGGGLDER
jgi:hypothetical protein